MQVATSFQNSVRHNLSLNKAFCKLERPQGASQRKGCLWSLKPERREQMDKEIRKWKKKHAEAIRASMANPGMWGLNKAVFSLSLYTLPMICFSTILIPFTAGQKCTFQKTTRSIGINIVYMLVGFCWLNIFHGTEKGNLFHSQEYLKLRPFPIISWALS